MAWGELLETEQYTYDLADKLIYWEDSTDYKEYSYDLRGNLTSVIGAIRGDIGELLINSMYADQSITDSVYEPDTVTNSVYGTMFDPQDLEPELLEQYQWGSDNRLQQVTNPWGDISRFSYDGDGNRVKMTVDVAHGPNGRGNGKGKGQGNGNGPGNGNGQFKCGHVVPPGFVPPGLAKKCGQGEEPYPDEHPGGPRDGWETQHKKKHWEFHYTNDISLALPEVLQVTEDDATKWKESFVYGAGMERISMTYLPAYDHDNGWEPTPGAGGADTDVTPKTLYYMTDIMGSTIGLLTQDGRLSARYHYDEFGMVLDSKKFDVNWPGPDNLYGYTGLEYDYYTDLNYARARYYKPEIGRFISEDTYKGTMWNTQSQNLYAYVHNNPLKYVDPSGHRSKEAADKIIKDNTQNIENAAANLGVNPAILAATIYAEQRLNVDWKDDLTDGIGGFYGLDTSIGVAQVRVSTAKFLEEEGYMTQITAQDGGWNIPGIGFVNGTETMARAKALENPEISIMYAAAYLKYFQDTWKDTYSEIDSNTAILATLFNIGHEATTPNEDPQSNYFGDFAKENYNYMKELLGID